MSRFDEHLSRSEQSSLAISTFLSPGQEEKTSTLTLRLYSSETKRLERLFPVKISKDFLFNPTIRLYSCTVRRA